MSFDPLGLAPEFLRAVADQGYTEPTPVQAEAIPLVLDGRDLMADAQTGTGKTAAFVLPMLQNMGPPNIDPRSGRRPIRALVLAPTRELALQVEESVRVYGRHWGVRSAAIYGGVGFAPQVNALRRGVDVVVATPGRLLDHLGQRTIDLSTVEILVLDEADRMLDMGFIRDIRRVLEVLPAKRQNLLFSRHLLGRHPIARARLPPRPGVRPGHAAQLGRAARDPGRPSGRPRAQARAPQQPDPHRRRSTRRSSSRARSTARTASPSSSTATGIAAVAIHGNKSQGQRVRALADFKSGRTPILVATEIAARGLDIDGLPHVVNFELPMVPEDYVHRIGRTGRAGSPGHAVSLVCVDELKLLGEIERVLGATIPQEVIAGFEPDRSVRPEPILRGGLGRGRPDPRGPRGPRAGGGSDRGGYAGPRRASPAFHPGGSPAQGRPAQGRPAHGRPAQHRPGQGIGNGGPGGRPGPRQGGQPSGRPNVLPGERFARSDRRG